MADWNNIERAYKEGKLSNVKLAIAHGVTEGAIRKEAKLRGWKKGEVYVPPAAKLAPVPPETLRRVPDTPETVTNKALGKDLVRRMLDELDATTSHVGELEGLIEAETAGDRDGRRRAGMLKAISLATRANTLKQLIAAQTDAEKSDTGKVGKKEQQAAAAVQAGSGKFKASAPPLRVVGKT